APSDKPAFDKQPGLSGKQKKGRLFSRPCSTGSSVDLLRSYLMLYFFLKRSTRPAVSTSCCLPVKNGCEALEISTSNIGYSLPSSYLIVALVSTVDFVRNKAPD